MHEIWWLAVPALVLLFFPQDWLLSRDARLGTFDHIFRERRTQSWNQGEWGLVIDPLRASAGTWLLQRAILGSPELETVFAGASHLVLGVVLVVATALQLPTRRDPDYLLAPLGFVAGVACILIEPGVAALVFFLAGGTLAAFRAWPAFFVVGAAGGVAIGFLLYPDQWVAKLVFLGVFVTPVLVSLVTGRQLMFPGR